MLNLFWAMIKKEYYDRRFYFFNTLSYIFTLYMIFLFVFLGAKSFLGNKTIEGIVVGFWIWGSTLDSYSLLSLSLISEARLGTLEQLFMIPYGFKWVSAAMIIANFIYSFLIQSLILILMMITTGKFLHLDVVSIIPLWIITIIAIHGLGFMLGGLALIYKRISSSYQIMQLVFAFLIAAPVEKHLYLKFLPLGLGYRMIQKVMHDGIKIWELPGTDLLILSFTSFFYLFIGFAVFSYFEKKARNMGVLSHY